MTTITAFQIKQFEKFGLTVDSSMSYDDAYATIGAEWAKRKTEKANTPATPKAKKPATKKAKKVAPKEEPVNTDVIAATMIYKIEVCTNQAKGIWTERTTIEATSPNKALRQYGIRGTRPRLGEATSKSGKRFRAINTGIIAA